jgi:uncharacterized protein (DUF2235 family)
LVDRVAAGAPIRKLLFVEVLRHLRMPLIAPGSNWPQSTRIVQRQRRPTSKVDSTTVLRARRGATGSKYVTFRGGLQRALPILLVGQGAVVCSNRSRAAPSRWPPAPSAARWRAQAHGGSSSSVRRDITPYGILLSEVLSPNLQGPFRPEIRDHHPDEQPTLRRSQHIPLGSGNGVVTQFESLPEMADAGKAGQDPPIAHATGLI